MSDREEKYISTKNDLEKGGQTSQFIIKNEFQGTLLKS